MRGPSAPGQTGRASGRGGRTSESSGSAGDLCAGDRDYLLHEVLPRGVERRESAARVSRRAARQSRRGGRSRCRGRPAVAVGGSVEVDRKRSCGAESNREPLHDEGRTSGRPPFVGPSRYESRGVLSFGCLFRLTESAAGVFQPRLPGGRLWL